MAEKGATTPRGSKPAPKKPAVKAKKPATVAKMPARAHVDSSALDKDALQEQFDTLQKEHDKIVLAFNVQQGELKVAQQENARLKEQSQALTAKDGGASDAQAIIDKLEAEIRSLETQNMNLEKKVQMMKVEHVSEEEVDQLFFALEQKEEQLALKTKENAQLEEDLREAQYTARGTNLVVQKVIEIHHHNDMEDESDDDEDVAGAKADAPKEVS